MIDWYLRFSAPSWGPDTRATLVGIRWKAGIPSIHHIEHLALTRTGHHADPDAALETLQSAAGSMLGRQP
jgi:hypothetical protein